MQSSASLWCLGILFLGACSAPGLPESAPARAVPALALDSKADPSSAVLATLPKPEQPAPELGAFSQLGWAASRSLSVAEMLSEWHSTAPDTLWLVLEKLVTARLADAEAERMQLRLPPEALALRFEVEQQRLQELLKREGLSLGSYISQEYGQSPEVFTQNLRAAVGRQMLIERVTRAWVHSNAWLRLRMIVVPDAASMQAVLGRLQAGEEFAALARELSQDGSGQNGGLVPFLVREEESPLSVHAFQQRVGELGLPFEHQGLQVLVRVEESVPARMKNDWGSLGPTVEASLLEFPLTDSEFGHWKLNMEQRYPIDVQPLLELLGVESSG
jgi:hypothetical protein